MEQATPAALQAFHNVRAYNVQAYAIITWLGALLAGGIVLQSVEYMQEVTGDARYLKTMVVLTTLAQVVSSVFEIIGHSLQVEAALENEVSAIVLVPWTQSVVVVCTLFSGLTSQLYFGRLVYRLFSRSPSRLRLRQLSWGFVFSTLVLASLLGGLGVTVCFVQVQERFFDQRRALVEFMGPPVMLYAMWLTSTAVLDLTLSAILVCRFLRDVRKDGFDATNSILTSLAVLTLETFSLTATLALADLGCAILASYSYGSVIPKLELACYGLTSLIQRSYAASFIFTLKRHAQVRSCGLGGSARSPAVAAAKSSSGMLGLPPNVVVDLPRPSAVSSKTPSLRREESSVFIVRSPDATDRGVLGSGSDPAYEEDIPLEILKGSDGTPYAVEATGRRTTVYRPSMRIQVDVQQTQSWDRMSQRSR